VTRVTPVGGPDAPRGARRAAVAVRVFGQVAPGVAQSKALAPGGSGPRVFRVRLQDPQGGASLGSPATALVWVLN